MFVWCIVDAKSFSTVSVSLLGLIFVSISTNTADTLPLPVFPVSCQTAASIATSCVFSCFAPGKSIVPECGVLPIFFRTRTFTNKV